MNFVDADTYNRHMVALTDTIKDLSNRVKQLEAAEVSSSTGNSFWFFEDVDNVARIVIPDGDDDMEHGGTFIYFVYEKAGGNYSGSIVTLQNGTGFSLYDDGSVQLTFACALNGQVTLQRTLGVTTFDVVMMGVWF